MYSANGVQRVLSAVDPNRASIVVDAQTPNSGLFGWTSNDLTSVRDLAMWVSEAQNAAESAQANADYTADVLTHVQTQAGAIDAGLVEVDNKITQLNNSITQVNDTVAAFNATYAVFVSEYNDFLVKYADFLVKWAEWKSAQP